MSQWTKFAKRLEEWTSPLRPSPEDIEMFKSQLPPNGRTLLLGATPELQPLSAVSVDHDPGTIEIHGSHTVLGDWSDLPFGAEFDAVIGDGSLNAFQGSPELFFQQAKKVLKKNGRIVLRIYISPDTKEDLKHVLQTKEQTAFHAFKWRVAQAIADPYIRVQDLYRIIRPIYDHPTLEIYRESDLVYYFPRLSELPPWDSIQFGNTYELAERCPVVTWHTNSSNLPGGNPST